MVMSILIGFFVQLCYVLHFLFLFYFIYYIYLFCVCVWVCAWLISTVCIHIVTIGDQLDELCSFSGSLPCVLILIKLLLMISAMSNAVWVTPWYGIYPVPIVGCKVACKGWQCICNLRHDKTNECSAWTFIPCDFSCDNKYRRWFICLSILSTYTEVERVDVISNPSNVACLFLSQQLYPPRKLIEIHPPDVSGPETAKYKSSPSPSPL